MVELTIGGREITELPDGAIEIELHKKAWIMRLGEDAEIGSDEAQGVCRHQFLEAGDWVMFTPEGGVIAVDPRGAAAQGWFPVEGFICGCCSRFFRGSPNPNCEDEDLCDECFKDLAENDPDFLIKTCRVCGRTSAGVDEWEGDDLCRECAGKMEGEK